MTTPLRGLSAEGPVGSLPVRAPRSAHDGLRPQRKASLMRKYEVAALLPDLSVAWSEHIAPAAPLFEETASAFGRGTLIETVKGPVAIEDLMPGDYIKTANGAEPVTWIGSTNYVPGRMDDATSLTGLTRITADANGPGSPPMDLLVGPGARMIVRNAKLGALLGKDAVLAPVRDYADGDRFLSVTPAGTVQLFHFMVRRHTTFNVGGIALETYHPGNAFNQQMGQNTRALFLSLFPNLSQIADFGETCATRTTRDVIDNLMMR